MVIRLQAIPSEAKKTFIDEFARLFVTDTADGEINAELMARTISVTLRNHGFLNARIDPDEFARACVKAREDRS